MPNDYAGVISRFLRPEERLIISKENDLPFVIEAENTKDVAFLQNFLSSHSEKILDDLAQYGAILLRGFAITSDEDFEKTLLSIKGFRGISDALMSEDGRIHVGELKYVLHTNAIYKTGGTLYLGGFHSENYYTPDVPAYISFCCLKPSAQGGETGLINMEKVYELLANDLKEQLENNTFFVGKWLVSEVAHRYQISPEAVEKVCHHFGLPIVGENNDKLIMMYKPSVFLHPRTQKKSLQINFFELPSLNSAMRRCFAKDYQGKTWFWHRFVWQLPSSIFKIIELVYVFFVSFFYSPKKAIKKWLFKLHTFKANYKKNIANPTKEKRVSHCFKEKDVTQLAGLMRDFYSSCLWKEGDILLVDNLKVVHAGMPGSGARLVRALIGNPIGVTYTPDASGVLECMPRTNTIGFYMTSGSKLVEDESAGKEIEA